MSLQSGIGGMGMVLDHASTSQVLVRSARRKGMKDIVAPMNASVRVEDLEANKPRERLSECSLL
jgi:hypothetical protein